MALTVTNASGNNTCTYPNWVAVRSSAGSVSLAPTYYSLGGGATVVSGSLSDTNTENGVYFVNQCGSGQGYGMWVYFPTGYTASQLSKLRIEMKVHDSTTVNPSVKFMIATTIAGYDMADGLWSTSDQWVTFEDTNVANYLRTDYGTGTIALILCSCPQNSTNYQYSWDVIRLVLWTTIPVADFSGTPTSGAAPLTVSFTDLSSNLPTAWSWTFGDGGTSTAQNPSHTYSSSGSYTVALTATNAAGSNTNTKSNYITVTLPPPVASFTTAYPTAGAAPLAVSFTDTSTNTPTSWSWNFGDSNTSTAQNPSHTYTSRGQLHGGAHRDQRGGNNTCTYPNWVAVRSSAGSVTFAPSDYNLAAGTVVSGGAQRYGHRRRGVFR